MADREGEEMAKILMLRTCNADMSSYNGFLWPESGPVECPDWDPEPKCGHGLHGLPWGEGDGVLLNWDLDAKWLVWEAEASAVVDIGGKSKAPKGTVVHCGDRKSATDFILANGGTGKAVVGAVVSAGNHGTATVGDRGTATAGDRGTATAGDYGTATAGYGGTATVGEKGRIQVEWWDGERRRLAVGYVGEDGIEAGKPYVVVNGKLVTK